MSHAHCSKGLVVKRNPSRHPLRQKGKERGKKLLRKDLRKERGKRLCRSFDALYALSDIAVMIDQALVSIYSSMSSDTL